MGLLKKWFSDSEVDIDEMQEHLNKGKRLLESQFYDRASVEFNKALQIAPEQAMPVVQGLFEDAEASGGLEVLSLGQNLLMAFPKNPELANTLGNLCRRHGQLRKAENFYRHALKADPGFELASYNLAATLAHSEEYDENARQAIREFEEQSGFVLPPYVDELAELCRLEYEQKHAEWLAARESAEAEAKQNPEAEAFEAPEPEIPEQPREPGQLFVRLRAEWNDAKTPQAKQAPFRLICGLGYHLLSLRQPISFKVLEWAVQRNPMDAKLRCFQFVSLSLKQPKLAVDKLIAFLAKVPNHRYALINLGLVYRAVGDTQASRRYLFLGYELLQRSQGRYEVESLFVEAQAQLKKNRRRAWSLLKDLRLDMTKNEQLLQLAELSLEFKEWTVAQECFAEVMLKDPKSEVARNGLGTIREQWLLQARTAAEKKEWQEAVLQYEKVIDIETTEEALVEGLEAAKELGEPRAIKDFERQLELMEQQDRVKLAQDHLERAMLLEGKRQGREALQEYQRSLLVLPQHKVFVQMMDCCRKFCLDNQAEQLSDWFEQVQAAGPEEQPAVLEFA